MDDATRNSGEHAWLGLGLANPSPNSNPNRNASSSANPNANPSPSPNPNPNPTPNQEREQPRQAAGDVAGGVGDEERGALDSLADELDAAAQPRDRRANHPRHVVGAWRRGEVASGDHLGVGNSLLAIEAGGRVQGRGRVQGPRREVPRGCLHVRRHRRPVRGR